MIINSPNTCLVPLTTIWDYFVAAARSWSLIAMAGWRIIDRWGFLPSPSYYDDEAKKSTLNGKKRHIVFAHILSNLTKSLQWKTWCFLGSFKGKRASFRVSLKCSYRTCQCSGLLLTWVPSPANLNVLYYVSFIDVRPNLATDDVIPWIGSMPELTQTYWAK